MIGIKKNCAGYPIKRSAAENICQKTRFYVIEYMPNKCQVYAKYIPNIGQTYYIYFLRHPI